MRGIGLFLTMFWANIFTSAAQTVRARDIGIPFAGNTGKFNAITDVKGVEVGHSAIITGAGCRRGYYQCNGGGRNHGRGEWQQGLCTNP